MAHSGVSVKDECVEEFNKIKLKKPYQFIVYKLSDNFEAIEIDRTEPALGPCSCEERERKFTEFAHQLPGNDCRYIVYDFHVTLGESGERDKLIFIMWNPESAKVKHKMVYASSKDALKKKLVGLSVEVQASDTGDLDFKEVSQKVGKAK